MALLDQILVSANKRRQAHQRITYYNFEVSTLATEQLAALEGQQAEVDCLMQIVLNYGKDMHTLVSRTSDIPEDMGRTSYEEPPRQKETLIKVDEYLKHLNHFDFCLKSSDEAYHHPFSMQFPTCMSFVYPGPQPSISTTQEEEGFRTCQLVAVLSIIFMGVRKVEFT